MTLHAARILLVAFVLLSVAASTAAETDTLPAWSEPVGPSNFSEMWQGFNPQAEALETEILHEFEVDDVQLRIVKFRIGVFKGTKATLVAIYGFPRSAVSDGAKLPGLVQIHGGGQYAHSNACVTNAKRGYATVSIAWAGRISAPGYNVGPNEVKLFWENKTDDPRYRVTTDWGAVDGYHAPGRNPRNIFPSAKAEAWTLDSVESPRNSGWFLCALAARRALTFLERQPEVDADRLGVYGHSMGGKLTVMASVDPRVKAAAPSCGGISDRYNSSPLFRTTIGDDVSLKKITCPIMFLSPANDFHGRLGDLPAAVREIQSKEWRVTCSPHHNHQDTAAFEVATQIWMDEHLKGSFKTPRTPETHLDLQTSDHTPVFTVLPDTSRDIIDVGIFYTHHGKIPEQPSDHEDTKTRFWHYAQPSESNAAWTAKLPLASTNKPLWVYANILYALDEPITGAGYYYGTYETKSFNLSSLLTMVSAEKLRDANVKATLRPSRLIEDFQGDWEKEWFTYRPTEWARTTNKLRSEIWRAPENATLAIDVRSSMANQLVVVIDGYAAAANLAASEIWQTVPLSFADFTNAEGKSLSSWRGVRQLKLCPSERLRPERGSDAEPRTVGSPWKGAPPEFRNLRWVTP